MKNEIFYELIDQLVELKFSGLISPHLYGEPMSDHRMLDWSAHIKKKLPNSKLKIVTNGDFLNNKNFYEYLNVGVDIFYISKHAKLLKKPCRDLLENLDAETLRKHVLVQDFFADFYRVFFKRSTSAAFAAP